MNKFREFFDRTLAEICLKVFWSQNRQSPYFRRLEAKLMIRKC